MYTTIHHLGLGGMASADDWASCCYHADGGGVGTAAGSIDVVGVAGRRLAELLVDGLRYG
jgi:hypothetical protein